MWSQGVINHISVGVMLTLWTSNVGVKSEGSTNKDRYRLEGKVSVPFTTNQDWIATTRIMVDGGQYLGFLKSDGSFSVNGVPSGSYVVEIASPSYAFEPARVEITSKGKMRARRVNNVHISDLQMLAYPLRFKARAYASYFQQREQLRITDLLMNPMVLMMVLPLLMIMVLPKLMNTSDPETQRVMQSQMSMLSPKQKLPDMSEMLTSKLGGGGSSGSSGSTARASGKPSGKPKAIKKR